MRIRRHFAGLFLGLLLFGLGPGVAPAAHAQSDLYTVHNIPVDATADDAASAREAALAAGHQVAVERMLKRIVPALDLLRVPELSAGQIAELVQDFSVFDERTSDVRYLAQLTFRFNPDAVREFLGRLDIPFAETRGEPVLVLPVFGPSGAARLWRDPNPWRYAWAARRLDSELVPMMTPLGDLGDIAEVSAEQALGGDVERMGSLMRRYGTKEVLVVQLLLTGEADTGWANAQVIGQRYVELEEPQNIFLNYRQFPDETQAQLLARAVEGAIEEVQEGWKQDNLLRLGEESSLMVTIPVRSLADWLEVQQRLKDVALVVGSELAYMTRGSVDVMLTYIGDEDQLARALAQKDLRLAPDQADGWWELSLGGAESLTGNQ